MTIHFTCSTCLSGRLIWLITTRISEMTAIRFLTKEKSFIFPQHAATGSHEVEVSSIKICQIMSSEKLKRVTLFDYKVNVRVYCGLHTEHCQFMLYSCSFIDGFYVNILVSKMFLNHSHHIECRMYKATPLGKSCVLEALPPHMTWFVLWCLIVRRKRQ